jgi:hypothetical protein
MSFPALRTAIVSISCPTVARHWRYARAWLYDRIRCRNTPRPDIRRDPAVPNEIP